MAPLIFPHGWCGDAWPGGKFVVQVPFHSLLTHDGLITLPAGESRGFQVLVMSRSGERFAGLMHDLGHVWEWDGGGWHDRGYRSGRVGYLGETLVDIDPPGVGYVTDDGRIVGYATSYLPKNGLSQWCETLGLQFGQSRNEREGVRLWDGRDRRIVDNGPCNEIHAHGVNGVIACSYRKDNDGFYIIEATVAEYLALPKDEELPPPPPQPPPPPPPENKMRLPDDVQDIVNLLYVNHRNLAEGDDDQRRALTKLIAETTRFRKGPDWGWKTAGTGRPPSKDAIAKKDNGRLLGWDLFNGTTRAPNDHPESEDITGQIFIEMQPVDHIADEPQLPPPPPDNTIEELKRELAAVRAELVALRGEVNAARGQAIAASGSVAILRADFDNYTSHPPIPTLPRLVARGSTSRSFGHAHSVELDVVPKP